MKISSIRSFFRIRVQPRIRIRRTVFHTRSRKLYLANREAARAIVSERVAHFNTHYKLPVGKIAIRNQKSRWGSCSRKGNLNFNYKLVFVDPELRDYVIVHEICHIKEFNHGPGFWALVGETVPNYREVRKRLKAVK
jgi:predicted metal-dependent hydrolase